MPPLDFIWDKIRDPILSWLENCQSREDPATLLNSISPTRNGLYLNAFNSLSITHIPVEKYILSFPIIQKLLKKNKDPENSLSWVPLILPIEIVKSRIAVLECGTEWSYPKWEKVYATLLSPKE
jgi:hypothetical protein